MNYTVNPCQACFSKFAHEDCNINDLNNCFVDTVSAFNRVPTNNIIYDDNTTNQCWKDCMLKRMSTMPTLAGEPRNFVNLQLNVAPTFTTPHYFPELFNQSKNVEKALADCYMMSKTQEERQTCWVDAQSLIPVEENFISGQNTLLTEKCKNAKDGDMGCIECCKEDMACIEKCMENPDSDDPIITENFAQAQPPPQKQPDPVYIVPPPPPPPPPPVYPTYQDVAADKPSMFWSIFVICSIVLAFLTVVFLSILVTRNLGK